MNFTCTEDTLKNMYRYLLKYVGTYRVNAEYDLSTEDFPRSEAGGIEESFEDLYIPCRKGIIKHTYLGDDILVVCFFDKGRQGRSTYETLKKKYPKLDILLEDDDTDVMIYFQAKDIKKIATVVVPKTLGASINPFSVKNLPKQKYKIPNKDLKKLYELTGDLSRLDTLQFFKRVNSEFLKSIKKKEIKKQLKESRLGSREFIHSVGLWDKYLKYVKDARKSSI